MDDAQVQRLPRNNGLIKIHKLPMLTQVMNMSFAKLLNILRMCPYSDYFGQPAILIDGTKPNRSQAITLVMKMITNAQLPK
mgnify:CR=1 FL=1